MRCISDAMSPPPWSRFSIRSFWVELRPDRRGSERRNAYGRRSVLDRHGEADADEHALVVRVEDARDDADDLAIHRDERAARTAGIGGGVELDQVGEQALTLRRTVLPPQSRDDAGRDRRPDAERKA